MSIKRIIVWLSRIRHVRGFGVQSPSAYRFIRYVVNEHYPYYAYSDLAREAAKLSAVELRLYKLYFRLANFMQPTVWLDILTHDDGIVQKYIHAGCNKTQCLYAKGSQDISSFQVLRVDGRSIDDAVVNELLSRADSASLLIIEGIHANRATKTLWQQIVADDKACVTYDLYDCGLVFFDKTKYKLNYIVNF